MRSYCKWECTKRTRLDSPVPVVDGGAIRPAGPPPCPYTLTAMGRKLTMRSCSAPARSLFVRIRVRGPPRSRVLSTARGRAIRQAVWGYLKEFGFDFSISIRFCFAPALPNVTISLPGTHVPVLAASERRTADAVVRARNARSDEFGMADGRAPAASFPGLPASWTWPALKARNVPGPGTPRARNARGRFSSQLTACAGAPDQPSHRSGIRVLSKNHPLQPRVLFNAIRQRQSC